MENDLENNKPSYEELLAELQREKQKTSLMEKKLEETNNKLEETNNKLERTNNKLDTITNILNNISDLIYNISKDTSIESSIYSMGNIGKSTLGVEECTIYGIDNINNRLYTSTEKGKREYISPDNKSLIQQVVDSNQPMAFNINKNVNIGDGKLNNSLKTKNALIVPLENRFGDTIGVAVSKGKAGGFKQSDIDAFFSVENGSVGNFFRVAIESRTNSLQATTDKLTSLNNRQGMENFIKASITDRINEEKSVSVAIFDIDKFKNFNDTYGHSVGDECLKQVANVIKNNLRATNDTGAFRFGGEEFIVVLPTNEEKAKNIIDRIRQKVENTPLKVGNEEVKVTVSAGVAQMKSESYGLSNEEVIGLFDETFVVADTALYQSKENGRNQVTASYEVDFQKIKDNVQEYHNKQNENNSEKGIKIMSFSKEKTEAIEYALDLTGFEVLRADDGFKLLNDSADYIVDDNGKPFTEESLSNYLESVLMEFDQSFEERVADYAYEKGDTYDNAIDYLNANEDVKQNVIDDGYGAMYMALDTLNNHREEIDFSSLCIIDIPEKTYDDDVKDFSVKVAEDGDYLMIDETENSVEVHVEIIGDDTLRNMLYDAVKNEEISQEVADRVLSADSDTYYDVYVDFKDDGNDSVSLVITDNDDKYYVDFSGDEPFLMETNFVENVAEEVRFREGKAVDEIINDISDMENDLD